MIHKYQKRDVTMQDVSRSIFMDPERIDRVILLLSPVRSGSTALLRLFAASGVQSHFQQVKNIMRWLMQGENVCWNVPVQYKPLLLKETFGPYTEIECCYNPMQIILDAGLPPERLHVVIIGRDPIRTWASWQALWGIETHVGLMIQSYLTIENIRRFAKEKSIAVTCLTYDIFGKFDIRTVIDRLFYRLKMANLRPVIEDWEKLPAFGKKGSNINLPVEPKLFSMPLGLVKIRNSSRFEYISGVDKTRNIAQSDLLQIEDGPVSHIYEDWEKSCCKDLGLDTISLN